MKFIIGKVRPFKGASWQWDWALMDGNFKIAVSGCCYTRRFDAKRGAFSHMRKVVRAAMKLAKQ